MGIPLPKVNHQMIRTRFKLNGYNFEINCRNVMINDLEEDGMTMLFGDVLITANAYGDKLDLANTLSKVLSIKEMELTFEEYAKHLTTKVANELWARRY
ncbi:MAG: hypothetical protein VW829_14135, partial [Deltaproteobacteria bacterium]